MVVGGSRSGKTFTLVDVIFTRARHFENSRHIILRKTHAAVKKSIAQDTAPKVLRLGHPDLVVGHNKSDGVFMLPNGSEVWYAGLDNDKAIDKHLGREFLTEYFNECSEISWLARNSLITRLAQIHENPLARARAFYDENPLASSSWTNQLFGKKLNPSSGLPIENPEDYQRIFMNPVDNISNLSAEYVAELGKLPEDMRRRFLLGEYVEGVRGALWDLTMFDMHRINSNVQSLPEMQHIVIGVDPNVSSGKNSDKCGIVAVGKAAERFYVIEDASGKYSPSEWPAVVSRMFKKHQASYAVAETNQGGELVVQALHNHDPHMPVRKVWAHKDKSARAVPIAQLYEQGKVSHFGVLKDLEDQLIQFTAHEYFGSNSPDNADAMIHAMTALMPNKPTPNYEFSII